MQFHLVSDDETKKFIRKVAPDTCYTAYIRIIMQYIAPSRVINLGIQFFQQTSSIQIM